MKVWHVAKLYQPPHPNLLLYVFYVPTTRCTPWFDLCTPRVWSNIQLLRARLVWGDVRFLNQTSFARNNAWLHKPYHLDASIHLLLTFIIVENQICHEYILVCPEFKFDENLKEYLKLTAVQIPIITLHLFLVTKILFTVDNKLCLNSICNDYCNTKAGKIYPERLLLRQFISELKNLR